MHKLMFDYNPRESPLRAEKGRAVSPVCQTDCIHADVVSKVKIPASGMRGAAELFSALADDTRLRVLYALSQAEMCVCDVAVVTGVSKAVASYHLRLLYRMGLASYRKDGRLVYYSIAAHDIVPVVEAALRYALAQTEAAPEAAVNGGEVHV